MEDPRKKLSGGKCCGFPPEQLGLHRLLRQLRQKIQAAGPVSPALADIPGDFEHHRARQAEFRELQLPLALAENLPVPENLGAAVGPNALQGRNPGPVGFDLDQGRAEPGAPVAQRTQQLIAGHGASQLGPGKSAAGDDELVKAEGLPGGGHQKPFPGLFDFFHLRAQPEGDVRPLQGKAQNVHHGTGLVGVGVNPAAVLRHGVEPQPPEPFQGCLRAEGLQGIPAEVRVLPLIAPLAGVEIRQIAAAVAGGLELPAHPGLPLQKDNLGLPPLRRSQGRRHSRGPAADDPNGHSVVSFPVFLHYTPLVPRVQEKLLFTGPKMCYNDFR